MGLSRYWELPVPVLPERLRLETVTSIIVVVSLSHKAKETPVTKSSLPQPKLPPTTLLKASVAMAAPPTQDSCLRMVGVLPWLPTYNLNVSRKLW